MSESRKYRVNRVERQSLVSHLREWFSDQNYAVQSLEVEDNGDLLQVSKKGTWRKFVGLSTALNVVLRLRGNELQVEIGAGKWIDKATTGTVSLFVLWPLAVTTAFGAWQQAKLPQRTFSAIDDYIKSPRFLAILFDSELERVEAATERVQVPEGVTAKVKRSRTIEYSVSFTTSKTLGETATQTYADFLSQTVKSEVEQRHGRSYQERETLEYEVELDGSKGTSYKLLWIDTFCNGTIEFSHSDEEEAVPFRFRTQTELQVTPGD